eukprot:scaffold1381_cov64-Cylindrotheca_fusiformis.AAC.13
MKTLILPRYIIWFLGFLHVVTPFYVLRLRHQQAQITSHDNAARQRSTSLYSSSVFLETFSGSRVEISDPIPSALYSTHKQEIARKMHPQSFPQEPAQSFPKMVQVPATHKPAPEIWPPYFVDIPAKPGFTSSFTFSKPHDEFPDNNTNKQETARPAAAVVKNNPISTTTFAPPQTGGQLYYMDEVKSIAASTAAMTVAAAMKKVDSPPSSSTTSLVSRDYMFNKMEKRLEALEQTIASLVAKQEVENDSDSKSISMQHQIDGIQKDLNELKEYDTVTVNWTIQNFENRIRPTSTTFTSQPFEVASFPMNLEFRIDEPSDGDDKRTVAFYIKYQGQERQYQPMTPISLAGTRIELDNDDDEMMQRSFPTRQLFTHRHPHGVGRTF